MNKYLQNSGKRQIHLELKDNLINTFTAPIKAKTKMLFTKKIYSHLHRYGLLLSIVYLILLLHTKSETLLKRILKLLIIRI